MVLDFLPARSWAQPFVVTPRGSFSRSLEGLHGSSDSAFLTHCILQEQQQQQQRKQQRQEQQREGTVPRGCITGRTRLAAFPRRGASGAQTARPVTGNIRSSRVSSRPGMPIALDSFAEGHFAHAPRAKRAPFGQDPAFQRVLCRGDVLGKRDSVSRQVDELERELRRMHHDHLVPPGPDFRPPLHLEKTPPLETFASRHMPAHPAQEDAADRKSSADSGEARSWRVLQSPDKRSPASVLVCLVPDARNAGSQLSLRPLPTCFQHSEDEAQIQAQEQDVRSTPRQLAEARFRGPFRRKYGSAPGRRCRDDATRTAESWENSNGNRSYEDGSKTKPPPKTAGDSVADITRQWGFYVAENKPESRRSDEHGELALARDSHTENTHVKAALRTPRALSGRRCMVLALWKGMANKTLERHGPTMRLHMERGFLADVEEADNVAKRIFQRKVASLGLS